MIVEVYAVAQGLADNRMIGWVMVVGNLRGDRTVLSSERAVRVGPWVRRDPEVINP